MKKINTFNQFIEEAYVLSQNDAPEITSQKSSFNKMQLDVKELFNKRVMIDNIYLTYKDTKDLISKLSAQKLILPPNTSDVRKIQFKNPLISIWAQLSQKKRDIRNVEDSIKTDEENLKNKKEIVRTTPSMEETMKDDIELANNQILDKKKKIELLNQDMIRLKKSIDKEIIDLKKDTIDYKNRIPTQTDIKK